MPPIENNNNCEADANNPCNLFKIIPPPPNVLNPWEDDLIGRKHFSTFLEQAINAINQPFVISIHAEFGSGKTFFLQRFKLALEKAGHLPIYFNSWETDFSQEPFAAFLTCLSNNLNLALPNSSNLIENIIKNSGRFLRNIVPFATKIALRKALGEQNLTDLSNFLSLTQQETEQLFSTLANETIKLQKQQQQTIAQLKQSLESYRNQFINSQKTNTTKSSKIVILIDELDRCRPSYAIDLLDKIKHLFSVKGYIFIIAVDDNQLTNYIKTVFGQDINTISYLRKFVDLRLSLPRPQTDMYCQMIRKKFALNNIDKYGTAASDFADWASIYNLSLREAEQGLTELNFAIKIIDKETPYHDKMPLWVCSFLIATKTAKHNLYYGFFCDGSIRLDHFLKPILEIISNHDNKEKLYNTILFTFLDRSTIGLIKSFPELSKQYETRIHGAQYENLAQRSESYGQYLYSALEDLSQYFVRE